MRFSAATIIALAASATAAVLPRADMGQWTVTLHQNEAGRQYMSATFTNEAYHKDDNPQRSTCIYDPSQDPVYFRCDRASTTFEYDGTTIKMSQGIALPNPMTVFGEAPLELNETNPAGEPIGSTVVPVNKAIA